MRACALAACFWLVGCATESDRVVVFAAASTADVVQRALDDQVVVSVGATSTLARQIEQGARADLFVAADPEWVDWLRERDVPIVDVLEVASGRMVVVGPVGAVGSGLEDDALRVAIADPTHVPAGRHAQRALEAVGLWSALEGRAVRTGDVRAALAAVEIGAADRAVVYASDARASSRVEVVRVFDLEVAAPTFVIAVLGDCDPDCVPREDRGLEAARALARSTAWADAGFDPPR
ncbi:molybdate ABC transporter substrate-binding protein [Rubrivirga sp.]|uniref:molybdate ABC transporter substrate-binding protein n=1 Tax=Rubrivirga sp. TaxID=1885344 RepID=UPI003C78718D